MIGELIVAICWFVAYLFFFVIAVVLLMAAFSFLKEKLTNLFGHPLKNTDEKVRKAYVMKLNDEELLKKVALTDYNVDVALQAVERIQNKSSLTEIAENAKFPISSTARRRLDEL